MMVFLLLAAIAVATLPAGTQSLSIKPSPPPYPPKSLSSRPTSRVKTPTQTSWGGRGDNKQGRRRQQQPLHAYTVADNNKPSWISFLKGFPARNNPLAEFASQFGSMEGVYMII